MQELHCSKNQTNKQHQKQSFGLSKPRWKSWLEEDKENRGTFPMQNPNSKQRSEQKANWEMQLKMMALPWASCVVPVFSHEVTAQVWMTPSHFKGCSCNLCSHLPPPQTQSLLMKSGQAAVTHPSCVSQFLSLLQNPAHLFCSKNTWSSMRPALQINPQRWLLCKHLCRPAKRVEGCIPMLEEGKLPLLCPLWKWKTKEEWVRYLLFAADEPHLTCPNLLTYRSATPRQCHTLLWIFWYTFRAHQKCTQNACFMEECIGKYMFCTKVHVYIEKVHIENEQCKCCHFVQFFTKWDGKDQWLSPSETWNRMELGCSVHV